jgi:hypothetical protein
MTIARSTARSVARPAARAVTGGLGGGGAPGPSYDTDALDYFTRAEALGGSFDLSGISGTYTESYVKTAISDFVAGCKTDSIWTKITEAYLLSGVTFGGVLAKLKHAGTAALTNVNFVSGDYLAAGSGAGLIGNGSTKRLTSGQNMSAGVAVDDLHLSFYTTVARTVASGFPAEVHCWIFGSESTTFTGLTSFGSGASNYTFWSGGYSDATTNSTFGTGYMCGTSRPGIVGTASAFLYKNGSSTSSNLNKALAGRSLPAVDMNVFCANNGGPFRYTDSRLSFVTKGTALTDTDAANLSTRINALMTALGANVY